MAASGENTPLLFKKSLAKLSTPLPWLQISVILLVQISEPLASQSIYPYIDQVSRRKPLIVLLTAVWSSARQ